MFHISKCLLKWYIISSISLLALAMEHKQEKTITIINQSPKETFFIRILEKKRRMLYGAHHCGYNKLMMDSPYLHAQKTLSPHGQWQLTIPHAAYLAITHHEHNTHCNTKDLEPSPLNRYALTPDGLKPLPMPTLQELCTTTIWKNKGSPAIQPHLEASHHLSDTLPQECTYHQCCCTIL